MRRGENSLGLGISFLVFSIVFLLSIFFNVYGFLKTDLVLVFLLTLASFAGFWEVLVFGLLSIFLMNWQPWINLEMAMLLIFPLGVNLGYRFLPGRPFLQSFLTNFLGVAIFYIVLDTSGVLSNIRLFLTLVFADLALGSMIFLVLNNYSRKNY